jgi:hypothetical protein
MKFGRISHNSSAINGTDWFECYKQGEIVVRSVNFVDNSEVEIFSDGYVFVYYSFFKNVCISNADKLLNMFLYRCNIDWNEKYIILYTNNRKTIELIFKILKCFRWSDYYESFFFV